MEDVFRVEWQGNKVVMPPEEVKHAIRVLRKKAGDPIIGIDGSGQFIRANLTDRLNDGFMELRVSGYEPSSTESPVEIHIIIPLLANRDRLEWMVEKATELGVTRMVVCRYERTESKGLNMKRIDKLIWAGMKQCQRSKVPEIMESNSLDEALHLINLNSALLACTCEEVDSKVQLKQVQYQNMGICWLIGPEGDLSSREICQLSQAGATWVDLGKVRLRAETAAIHVLSYTKAIYAF